MGQLHLSYLADDAVRRALFCATLSADAVD
jgi:hypothetical protein